MEQIDGVHPEERFKKEQEFIDALSTLKSTYML